MAVDLRILDRRGMERSGLGRYALETLRALRQARPDWRLTVHSNRRDLLAGTPGITLRPTRWPTATTVGRIAWLHAAPVATDADADVWFGTTFVLPSRWRGPAVVTVHDLVFALRPGLYRGRLNSRHARRSVARSVERADAVLCGSAVTAERIVEHLGVPAERVIATPWGVDEPFAGTRPDREPAPGAEYALFVGRWEARKGIDVLDAALSELARRGQALRLVLAGGPGWKARGAVSALLGRHDVEVVRDPDDERLAELYAGALALVYPSRMEGFGLPVAEAMACGCPPVCSDLPEIRGWAGDAATYFPAGDASALADVLAAFRSDPLRRREAGERGRAFAAGLRWSESGEAAAGALEAAVARHSG